MLSFRYYVTYFAWYLLIIKFKEVCSYIKYDSIYMYENIGNKRVKQCENLKKKLQGVNICCFSTIFVIICVK